MTIEKLSQSYRFEPRWPVILAIFAVISLLAFLPGRIRLFPTWAPYVIGLIVLLPIIAVWLTKANPRWLRIERVVTLFFVAFIVSSTLANLANLIQKMIGHSTEVGGLQLFASSIAVWVNNVLAFSLLYWQIDRNGPEARANYTGTRPDWLFPQEGAPF